MLKRSNVKTTCVHLVPENGGSATVTPDPSPAVPVTVVEFYRSVSDHYFITIAPDEIAALDTGLFQGWAAGDTGMSVVISVQDKRGRKS